MKTNFLVFCALVLALQACGKKASKEESAAIGALMGQQMSSMNDKSSVSMQANMAASRALALSGHSGPSMSMDFGSLCALFETAFEEEQDPEFPCTVSTCSGSSTAFNFSVNCTGTEPSAFRCSGVDYTFSDQKALVAMSMSIDIGAGSVGGSSNIDFSGLLAGGVLDGDFSCKLNIDMSKVTADENWEPSPKDFDCRYKGAKVDTSFLAEHFSYDESQGEPACTEL